jgi:hydrogenase maturation protease
MRWSCVVGLGSHHGDDQVGWLVLDRLQARGYPSELLIRARHPLDLLDRINASQTLLLCDACVGVGQPGTIQHFHWPTDRIAYTRPLGSHDLSLHDVLELGQCLGICPPSVRISTVEGGAWIPGTPLCAAVTAAAMELADAIWQDSGHA